MNLLKKFTTPLLFGFLIFSLALLPTSCKQDNDVQTTLETHKEIDNKLKLLEENGIDVTNASVVKEGILVEDDMIIPFEAFDAEEDINPSGRTSQYHIGNALLVTPANGNIDIFVDAATFNNTNFASNLTSAVNSSAAEYNAFCSFINFNITNNRADADLIIRNGGGSDFFGRAIFPLGGRIGTEITINESAMITAGINSLSGCRRVISHEIGHTLGLRHSDWNQTISHRVRTGFWPFYQYITIVDHAQEPQDGNDPTTGQAVSAVIVPGTPVSDPASIMNRLKHQEAVVFNGFSAFDKLTIETIYPNPVACVPPCPLPQITTARVDGVQIQYGTGIRVGSHSLSIDASGNPNITFSSESSNIVITSQGGGTCYFNFSGGGGAIKVTLVNSCYNRFEMVGFSQIQ